MRSVPPRLLIFDCDGVLVDTEPVSNRIFAEAITAAGLPTTFEDSMARYRGRSTAACIAMIESALGRALPEGWLAGVNARLWEEFDKGVAAVPGAEAVIHAARQAGIRICVASSSGLPRIRKTLASAGLLDQFGDALFSASMVCHGKPAPDLFLHAAEVMDAQPADCAVIEDSVPGALAGRAAGMAVIGYAGERAADAAALEAAGAAVIRDMREAIGHLRLQWTSP